MQSKRLVNEFAEELADANVMTFPIIVDSFTNLWSYEFGSLQNLPSDIDRIIASRATELGMLEP